jgi:hypothetical protein
MPVMISRPLDAAMSATAAASGCASPSWIAAISAAMPPASVSSVRSAESISELCGKASGFAFGIG